MANKQIYAALEIADYEVRLVVGEFYETRFNVLRVERVQFNGIENKVITNESNVVNAIIKACNKASNILGYKIDRVLLAIPCVDVVRQGRKVNVTITNASRKIQLSDIQRGINQAIRFQAQDYLELVNIGCIKYIVNGISSRKLPLNETCDQFSMDVDLFYANKKIIYSYAAAVEKAGLEILDICLDAYAIAEEAALFEKAIENYIVLVNLARQNTTLSLFSRGKLLSCECIDEGYGNWVSQLKDRFNIKTENCFRLIQDNAVFKEENYTDRPIFIWSENNAQKTLTLRELNQVVTPPALNWIEKLNEACLPIKEQGDITYIVTGEGMEIQGLRNLFGLLNAPAKPYVPETIGGRNCALGTCLGMFYAWKSLNAIRMDERICADYAAVERSLNGNDGKNDEEHGFTKKLKNILMSEK